MSDFDLNPLSFLSTTMSITAVLISPGKENRSLLINSPTVRALDSADLKDITPDSSWGDVHSVHLEEEEDGSFSCTRERPTIRHENVKVSARELRNECKVLHDEVAALGRRQDEDRLKHTANHIHLLEFMLTSKRHELEKVALVEQYESVSVCLRAYNDMIYDLKRPGGLEKCEKKALKGHNLLYITQLIMFDLDAFEDTNTPLSKQSRKVIKAVTKALSLLTPAELSFCQQLQKHLKAISPLRNDQQHPKPTPSIVRSTISHLLEAHHIETLDRLLASGLQRMRMPNDEEDTDRSLLAAAGASRDSMTSSSLQIEVQSLEDKLKSLHAEIAVQGGAAAV